MGQLEPMNALAALRVGLLADHVTASHKRDYESRNDKEAVTPRTHPSG